MADPVSGILTIVTVSLAVVREIFKYIQEINLVNDSIKSLLTKLKDLHNLLRVVQATYERADYGETNPSSHFVGKTITTCQKRLSQLKPLVYELAACESDTWLQKLSVKRKSDAVKKDIEVAIRNILCDMEYIRTGISCWSLDVASANRRISEAIAAQHDVSIRTNSQTVSDQDISPLEKSMSNAETVLGYDSPFQLGITSTVISQSRDSVSSTSSEAFHAQSDDNESVLLTMGQTPPRSHRDWMEFHFKVGKCDGNERSIEEIRKVLELHSENSALAASIDGSKRTPLHIAAQRGDIRVAHLLLEYGADINARDSEPSSVLDLAIANNHRRFVSFLLDRGVDQTKILDRNMQRLREMKGVISFSKEASKSPRIKKESRKFSWIARST